MSITIISFGHTNQNLSLEPSTHVSKVWYAKRMSKHDATPKCNLPNTTMRAPNYASPFRWQVVAANVAQTHNQGHGTAAILC